MNELDQYAKRQLLCKHYGRYVDDFYVVSADRGWLRRVALSLKTFLNHHLGLDVNEKKTIICYVWNGVPFLGAYLKPYRRYVNNATLHRMKKKVGVLHKRETPELLISSLNSFLGLMSHYCSYNIKRKMFYHLSFVYQYGHYLRWMRKYVLSTR